MAVLDQKLTIGMVTNNYTPYSGGVVSSIQALAHALRAQGHRVIIITLDFDHKQPDEIDLIRLNCIWHCEYKKNPIALPIGAKKQIQRLLESYNIDILHVHHPFLLGPAAVGVARTHKMPIVFTHHSLYEHYVHYVPLPSWIVRPLARKVVRDFCAKVDHVIVPGNSIKQYLSSQGVSQEMSVVSSGILPFFAAQDFLPKQPLQDRRVELLTVSRFAPEKNIEWLLSMFAYLTLRYPNKFALKLMGYGAWLGNLRELTYQRLCLSSRDVNFVERPTKQELLQAYQQADLFVFASQSETQGLVVAEAFSQSTPVLALKGPGVEDSVINGANGFLVTTMEEMVEKIDKIAQNALLFEHLQKGAFASGQLYHPASTAQQTYQVYQQLLGRKKK